MTLLVYMLRLFLKSLVAAMVSFIGVVIAAHTIERLSDVVDHRDRLGYFLQYLAYNMPEWIVYLLPVAVMLAVLFTLTRLSRDQEIIAMRACGISPYRLAVPFVILGMVAAMLALFINDGMVGRCNRTKRAIWREKIRGLPPEMQSQYEFLVRVGGEDRMYSIRLLDASTRMAHDIGVYMFDRKGRLNNLVVAARARESGHMWLLENGVQRSFDPDTGAVIAEFPFQEQQFEFPEKMREFFSEEKRPDEQGYWELRQSIAALRRMGQSTFRQEVFLNFKIAFPLANIVMAILAVSFGLRAGKTGRIKAFALCLGVSFVYWGLMNVGRALGSGGWVPPALAAWLANIVFLGVAAVMWTRLRWAG